MICIRLTFLLFCIRGKLQLIWATSIDSLCTDTVVFGCLLRGRAAVVRYADADQGKNFRMALWDDA